MFQTFGQFVSHVHLLSYFSTFINFNCLAVNCSEPPARPGAGTWEWNKEYSYQTSIIYTCGPYGNFKNEEGQKYEEFITECAWNKTWMPPVLDESARYAP